MDDLNIVAGALNWYIAMGSRKATVSIYPSLEIASIRENDALKQYELFAKENGKNLSPDQSQRNKSLDEILADITSSGLVYELHQESTRAFIAYSKAATISRRMHIIYFSLAIIKRAIDLYEELESTDKSLSPISAYGILALDLFDLDQFDTAETILLILRDFAEYHHIPPETSKEFLLARRRIQGAKN
jgi:trehalose/maltose hydrolase-like predicted phosphorylase